MTDLRKLLEEYKASRLKYPSAGRRESEDNLLGGIIDSIEHKNDPTPYRIAELNIALGALEHRVEAIEAEIVRRRGGRPKTEEAA